MKLLDARTMSVKSMAWSHNPKRSQTMTQLWAVLLQLLSYGLGLDCGAAASTGACEVAYVAPNGPAQLAGVLASDTVTRFNGRQVDAETSKCVPCMCKDCVALSMRDLPCARCSGQVCAVARSVARPHIPGVELLRACECMQHQDSPHQRHTQLKRRALKAQLESRDRASIDLTVRPAQSQSARSPQGSEQQVTLRTAAVVCA